MFFDRKKILATFFTSLPFMKKVDSNFIGFDKYRKKGAFHWKELETNSDYRAKVEIIKEYVSPEDTCLDLGCGDGAYAGEVARTCKKVVGVDADQVAIKLAIKKTREYKIKNCEFTNKSIGNFVHAFNHNKFDVIYSMDVIEHLPDPIELIKVSEKLLGTEGTILIGTPLFISDELISPYHVKEFTIQEIRGLISQYLSIEEEKVLPLLRKDGKVHQEGFYIAVAKRKICDD
ncbi:MAG: methyltransferase domain-containing protein [Aphanizomenon gracile PMC627.10]|nr:methyltransferase domain-containing protein [Aphanizomenon gracile PMC627.10]